MTHSKTADERLRTLYEREWAWRQREFAGADDEDHFAESADHLPSVNARAQAARATWWRQALVELQSITRDDLSDAEKLNAEVFEAQLRGFLEDLDVRHFELPFNSDTAFWSNLGFTADRKSVV